MQIRVFGVVYVSRCVWGVRVGVLGSVRGGVGGCVGVWLCVCRCG